MSASAFQVIDGIRTYNLFGGGEWIPSSRNEAAASYNAATGELYARVHQARARETALAIEAVHAAYRTRAETVVSEGETVFLCAADALAAKIKGDHRRSYRRIWFGRRKGGF
jgi:vanillin dehydrogenase